MRQPARPFVFFLGTYWLLLALASFWSQCRMKQRMMQAPLPSRERIL